MNYKEIIDNCEYVSFDIFDTLIIRNLNDPKDLFIFVEKLYNSKHKDRIKGFKENRVMCESECRKEVKREVTLDDIYGKLLNYYSQNEVDELKKIEVDTEYLLCQRTNNKIVNDIYEYAKSKKKKILIISDMYLDYSFIEKLLKKNNITYDRLYLSSKIGLRKKNKELFEYVLKDLNIDSSSIVHIGDNKISDYSSPKKLGLKAILITNKKKCNSKQIKKSVENIEYNIIQNFINNNINATDYYEKFGYRCFGPLLFGFMHWLKNELEKERLNKVFFLARDGKIMERAFNTIYPNNDFKTEYFYASRRALIVPSFADYDNIDKIIFSFNIPNHVRLSDLITRLGLEQESVKEEIEKYNLNYETKYNVDEIKDTFLSSIYNKVVTNSKLELSNLNLYLDKMSFKGKVAIVDIGWYGNMQLALNNISKDSNIHGYYLGLRKNKKGGLINKGYMFDINKNEALSDEQLYFNAIFELIFTANHGSVKRFINNKNSVELFENENNEEIIRIIEAIQDGAINFCKDFASIFAKEKYILDVDATAYNFFDFLNNPTLEDARKFGCLKFKDGDENYLANNRGKLYFIKPHLLFIDFKKSQWKIGFLKSLMKIPFPYSKFCKYITRLKK